MDVARELPRVRGGNIAAALCGRNTSVRSAHHRAWHFAPHAADPRACWKLSAHVSSRRRSGRAHSRQCRYHLHAVDAFGFGHTAQALSCHELRCGIAVADHAGQTGPKMIQEARAHAERLGAERVAPAGEGQRQVAHRPRQADVAQPPLFLDALLAGSRLFSRTAD